MNRLLIESAVTLALIASLIAGGWFIRGWYDGNAALRAAQDQHAASLAVMDAINQNTAAALSQLQTARRAREGVVHEITKIEYRDRECFDPGLVSVLNAAASDSSPPTAASSKVP